MFNLLLKIYVLFTFSEIQGNHHLKIKKTENLKRGEKKKKSSLSSQYDLPV